MIANVDVDAEHSAAVAEQLQHRRVKDQRTAVGDARLDDEIRLSCPNDLLHCHEVLRKLNDRPAEPREVVRVLVRRNGRDPVARGLLHGGVAAEPVDVFLHLGNESRHLAHFAKSFQQTVRGAITSRPACPQLANKSNALTNGVNSPCSCGYGCFV